MIGDAAGLILPITFEGIGSALKSGIQAADAIVKFFDHEEPAVPTYLKSLKPIVETIGRLCRVQEALKAASSGGPDFLARALRDAYRETLTVQERVIPVR